MARRLAPPLLAAPAGTRSVPATAIDPAKLVRLMLAFFGDTEVPRVRAIDAAAIPLPDRSLLEHSGHMTVALERHHGGSLAVHPYRIRREGDIYGRRIDLTVAGRQAPVMTGIMIFNLALVAAKVRDEIVQAESPLGEILIRHRILRRVNLDAFLEFDAADPLVARFRLPAPRPAYGRLATIDCNGRPAVDLLEIVRPQAAVAAATRPRPSRPSGSLRGSFRRSASGRRRSRAGRAPIAADR